jgi:hypothetical protein
MQRLLQGKVILYLNSDMGLSTKTDAQMVNYARMI